jgi:uncharacterized protein YbcC (UPF0753/DUF2309 family)
MNMDIRHRIRDTIANLGKVLPNQAPILEFVHFNILEGYQHLPFPEAIKAAREHSGQSGYWPDERYREFFKIGRITLNDLHHSLNNQAGLNTAEDIGEGIKRRDVYTAALLHTIKPVTRNQLHWQLEHQHGLRRIQADVSSSARQRLLASGNTEAECLRDLWQACLQALGLSHELLHPEELMDFDAERTLAFLRQAALVQNGIADVHGQMREESLKLFDQMQDDVGTHLTLRGFLKLVTGHDLLDDIRPPLLRHLANYLDQGVAAWHNPARPQGFYAAWKASAEHDLAWAFEYLPGWRDDIADLPDDPLDTILTQLSHLGIPESRWERYLQCLALELPGWSSMVMWRAQHPAYEGQTQPVSMTDYLAVRLVLERAFATRVCRNFWQIEANLDTLRWYFHRRRSEFFVRHALFNRRLPEYLVNLAQRQRADFEASPGNYDTWKPLADMIMIWLRSPMSNAAPGYSLLNHAWPLFRLAQLLGLDGAAITRLDPARINTLFDCLDRLDTDTRGFVWLQAFERNYREQLFAALGAHRNQGRWKQRGEDGSRPQAQLVFCMDDREEGIRRHLEEHNPQIETLGAAGFFGVAISYTGLDDTKPAPLCPVVVTPAHKIHEMALADQLAQLKKHQLRRRQRLTLREILHQHSRRDLLAPAIVTAAAPLAFSALLARSFAYIKFGRLSNRLRRWFDGKVKTSLTLRAESDVAASPDNPRLGFTDAEQADRIFNFLRNINLQQGLAPFVVMVGHGSISQNNPHLAAYDCGACSGRHGGPNARAFAAMANRPEIRALLQQRGFSIPDDTWFLGAEHNTADDSITWYDTELIPAHLHAAFSQLKTDVHMGSLGSAHERCRRLASAPQNASAKKSLRHMRGRTLDFSQARPELGHMNHAAAVIGRRALTQGLFLDRRVFLISYNPLSDPDGSVLEGFLGLNAQVVSTFLDYYFCAVNNGGYGSGSKVTHNITGLFGVMDGGSSDLRTGLAQQMVEIHEAMRPHVLVEAHADVLANIYGRQPLLQELIGNRWLLLSAIHPDTGEIQTFDPATGFIPWRGDTPPLPVVARSADWYTGHSKPLPPAQIKPEARHA